MSKVRRSISLKVSDIWGGLVRRVRSESLIQPSIQVSEQLIHRSNSEHQQKYLVKVNVIEARNISAILDYFKLSIDACVCVRIGYEEQLTTVWNIQRCGMPNWNSTFNFIVEDPHTVVQIDLYDIDALLENKVTVIGTTTVALSNRQSWLKLNNAISGEILIEISIAKSHIKGI